MDAIVLVGGQGTRLRPLTRTRHKSLVPVCNRPVIEYLFDWLRRSGFERVVMALGQHNEDLAQAYPAGVHHGMEFVVIEETTRLESGGGIRNAVQAAVVEGRFAVLNGDIYIDIDFAPALTEHEAHCADLTIYLTEVDNPSQFGVAALDSESMITGFVEKPPPGTEPSRLINAGLWIFEPQLVAQIPPGPVRVEETLFPSLVGRGRPVYGHEADATWADIGTSERYLAINRALVEAAGTSTVGEGVVIDGQATVAGSSVGDGCVLRPGVDVHDSILWERVTLEADVHVTGSIVANDVEVGAGAVIDGAVIGAGAKIGAGAVLRPGTVVEPGERYDSRDAR